jgi:hypothetical protein
VDIQGRTLTITFSAVPPDAARFPPTPIMGISFLRQPIGAELAPESGIVGGELVFLTIPDKPMVLRPGINLLMEKLDAVLQSLSFSEDTVVANVLGEVDKVSLQAGRHVRDVQPKVFDYVINTRMGRAILGLIAALVGLLGNIETFLRHAGSLLRGRRTPTKVRPPRDQEGETG